MVDLTVVVVMVDAIVADVVVSVSLLELFVATPSWLVPTRYNPVSVSDEKLYPTARVSPLRWAVVPDNAPLVVTEPVTFNFLPTTIPPYTTRAPEDISVDGVVALSVVVMSVESNDAVVLPMVNRALPAVTSWIVDAAFCHMPVPDANDSAGMSKDPLATRAVLDLHTTPSIDTPTEGLDA